MDKAGKITIPGTLMARKLVAQRLSVSYPLLTLKGAVTALLSSAR